MSDIFDDIEQRFDRMEQRLGNVELLISLRKQKTLEVMARELYDEIYTLRNKIECGEWGKSATLAKVNQLILYALELKVKTKGDC